MTQFVQTLWSLALLLLILFWDLRILAPGFSLAALGLVLILTYEQGTAATDLAGIALGPVLGSLAFAMGYLSLSPRQYMHPRPPLFMRMLAVTGTALAASTSPLHRVLPYMPDLLQDPGRTRMLLLLLLASLAFLSLAEAPIYFGFGFLMLVLLVNVLVYSAYGETRGLMLLLNVLQLATLLVLGHQALRIPLWISQQPSESRP